MHGQANTDNEIYLLIKYIKSILWRVSKRLSYIEEARCLKANKRMLIRSCSDVCCVMTLHDINIRDTLYSDRILPMCQRNISIFLPNCLLCTCQQTVALRWEWHLESTFKCSFEHSTSLTEQKLLYSLWDINLQTPNVNYSWRTTPLTSKIAFYIFIQQIEVPNILNMVYTLRFFLFKMQFVS